MIDEPRILQTTARRAAVIHVTCPRDQIRDVMGPGYSELMDTLKAQGLTPTGPWFTHHFKMDPAVFDFEICAPLDQPVKPAGRVKNGELPAARAAFTVHHGGYEDLPAAWAQFDAWISTNDHKPAEGLWEVYAVGPGSGDDASKWQTELYRPLQQPG